MILLKTQKKLHLNIIKQILLNEIVDLFNFLGKKLDGKLKALSQVAIRILSIMCTSASVEREFSSINGFN